MRPNLQKILQAIEENFSWLHTGIREKNYQWIEDTILAIGTLRLEASIFLNRDEEVKNTNNLFFKEKIFLIQSEDPHEYHYLADKKVISQQLTGFYLLLSGIAMLIFSEREKNITHAITLASQLMKSAEKNSIENFLVLFLREGLQVNRKALATPLLFVFLNLMDRTIYQRPSDNL